MITNTLVLISENKKSSINGFTAQQPSTRENSMKICAWVTLKEMSAVRSQTVIELSNKGTIEIVMNSQSTIKGTLLMNRLVLLEVDTPMKTCSWVRLKKWNSQVNCLCPIVWSVITSTLTSAWVISIIMKTISLSFIRIKQATLLIRTFVL